MMGFNVVSLCHDKYVMVTGLLPEAEDWVFAGFPPPAVSGGVLLAWGVQPPRTMLKTKRTEINKAIFFILILLPDTKHNYVAPLNSFYNIRKIIK
jgi:hypothetical protein